jgi:preprotein translocase subunit SecD
MAAIVDGNVTTIFAAAFLFQFGTGPIKGFGITLMLGLTISMATAVWVTHLFYDVWFEMARPKELSV